MRVALKVDVLTRTGARSGVPALLELFGSHGIRASFAFGVGMGVSSTWRRLIRREPSLPESLGAALRAVVGQGHEVGISAYDVRAWLAVAAHADAAWISETVRRAIEAFERAAGRAPDFFAAAGWQVNPQLLSEETAQGWPWASDTRGRYPYLPLLQGVRSTCIQIPTTLPTLDEVLASGVADLERAHEYLYAESQHVRPAGHVYTADAEREGGAMLDVMEKLVVMWKGYEGSLRPLGALVNELQLESLPVHQIGWGEVPGRAGYLAMQSVQVPR